MRVTVHDAIAGIGRGDWNRLAGNQYPFLKYEFLHAAESSGCVSDASGWSPCHLALRHDDGSIRAALPLYQKDHSWGEFVFDWAWANAYERAGLTYYPKLVSAVPYTPAASARVLLANAQDREAADALIQASIALADERECSSVHFLFPSSDQLEFFEDAGLKLRKDCQFHWKNQNYNSFDEFLTSFSSSKRKKARRDRRRVLEAGIKFRRLTGRELRSDDWEVVYRLVSRTFLRRGSLPYYNLDFFEALSQSLPDNVLVVMAEDLAGPVAAAVFYVGRDTLYGRYWGSAGHYNALHFETCYYQGIDYCIEHGISTFEPGTQGEHKISRGFVPQATWSAHWLAHPEFFSAIGSYVAEESRHIDRYMQAVDDHSPFRRNKDAT
ncbi:MAG: GNAT family N-acetyltransferase [Gammaproteobacteria bacterium]|nr:GNAT family N-acetyltransferase [Gammaproteobacteria bacterium]